MSTYFGPCNVYIAFLHKSGETCHIEDSHKWVLFICTLNDAFMNLCMTPHLQTLWMLDLSDYSESDALDIIL